jgi:hypothetical protein
VRKTLAERFWAKVAVVDDADSCWVWKGAVDRTTGYGMMKVASYVTDRTHRVSYILAHASIPDGKQVLHICHNRLCVRPKHLYAGTYQDNVDDMMKAGRNGGGGQNPRVSDDIAAHIVVLYERGEFTHRDLAAFFGISKSVVTRILAGDRWGLEEAIVRRLS